MFAGSALTGRRCHERGQHPERDAQSSHNYACMVREVDIEVYLRQPGTDAEQAHTHKKSDRHDML